MIYIINKKAPAFVPMELSAGVRTYVILFVVTLL